MVIPNSLLLKTYFLIFHFVITTNSQKQDIHNLLISSEPIIGSQVEEEVDVLYEPTSSKNGNECTYFAGARFSAPESSLVNCSWYKTNACCKRTEVTSVFGGMPPLYKASKTCRYMMNYLMCFFCSPYQKYWYKKGRAVVCADFCNGIVKNCKDAYFQGIKLGSKYVAGEEFCKAQNFQILRGQTNCFNYDPSVFGEATMVSLFPFILYILLATVLLSYW